MEPTTTDAPASQKTPAPAVVARPPLGYTPPPAEIPSEIVSELKSRAAEASGSDELMCVRFEGIGHDYAVRHPSRAEWNVYLNKAHDPQQSNDGNWNMAAICTVWPARTVLAAERKMMPALPVRICNVIESVAGFKNVQAFVLDAKVPEDVIADLGLPMGDVEALRRQYPHKGQLRVAVSRVSPDDAPVEQVVVIVKTPSVEEYNLLTKGIASEGKAEAAYDAASSCIVYPREERDVRKLLDERPGIAYGLVTTLLEMGGATARTTVKKL